MFRRHSGEKWRNIIHIASRTDCELAIIFIWDDNTIIIMEFSGKVSSQPVQSE